LITGFTVPAAKLFLVGEGGSVIPVLYTAGRLERGVGGEGASPPLLSFPPLEQILIRAYGIDLFMRGTKGASINEQPDANNTSSGAGTFAVNLRCDTI
jgi:hypothetical protein